jgi:stearoyl-CoA desaturase (delta-9 desaturase)
MQTANVDTPNLPPASNGAAGRNPDRPSYIATIPYFFVHAACLLGIHPSLRPSWGAMIVCIAIYYLRMFGITAGYHRYFSHRSYKTGRVFQFILAAIGTTSLQKGVLWWAAHHRTHHKYSDEPRDIHSPRQRGLYWAHQGWILSPRFEATDWPRIQDFAKYPELRWLNQHFIIPALMAEGLLFLVSWLVTGNAVEGLRIALWGGFFSTVLLWHGTFTINSLAHVWGSRRYKTTDDSRNNFILALITMGEGWHNNHHYYQSTANQGFFWWEVDFSYYILKVLSWFGIVWDLRTPPAHVLDVANAPAQTPRPEKDRTAGLLDGALPAVEPAAQVAAEPVL